MKRLLGRLLCLIGDHDWTSKAMQGLKPTPEEVAAGYEGFLCYAVMYCSRCGTVGHGSRLNYMHNRTPRTE
jgi:hypothetical protein